MDLWVLPHVACSLGSWRGGRSWSLLSPGHPISRFPLGLRIRRKSIHQCLRSVCGGPEHRPAAGALVDAVLNLTDGPRPGARAVAHPGRAQILGQTGAESPQAARARPNPARAAASVSLRIFGTRPSRSCSSSGPPSRPSETRSRACRWTELDGLLSDLRSQLAPNESVPTTRVGNEFMGSGRILWAGRLF